eukprot:CAMPEP_0182917468 /NCGR_PEP_ID=MMETSP0105_2-20130417/1541_1 /TAXON_ID=81532 ORGANISM="Acanthoeca-like sp., Strain 10tr" /NCGR_SAMPLE_ID=MMETSP0105_2 /ASSEMBLY_ACC=CAM_ASM_000205 /LENGTH=129 /DNA_ID=CAMNT_0025054477 /DNA_START=231 /DNA_END=616 /DNA_ORIENTATION=-
MVHSLTSAVSTAARAEEGRSTSSNFARSSRTSCSNWLTCFFNLRALRCAPSRSCSDSLTSSWSPRIVAVAAGDSWGGIPARRSNRGGRAGADCGAALRLGGDSGYIGSARPSQIVRIVQPVPANMLHRT